MKKILLVENDVFLINVYANQFRKSGYSTSIAIDGEIAIKRAKKIAPDLLILGHNPPKIDGFSVLRTIREDTGLKELKAVMISNFDQGQEFKGNLEFGPIKCFAKAEKTPEEIAEEIKKILS